MNAFLPPMLCSRLTDTALLHDPRYIAEPKLDGMRVQLHIAAGRVVRCYSRGGRDQCGYRGLSWLGSARWPAEAAVLDGEAFTGNGCDGVDAVFAARDRDHGGLGVAVFDLLQIGGRDVTGEAWEYRRQRLLTLCGGLAEPRLQVMPTHDDAPTLWKAWVEVHGGEGIVLKDRRSVYRLGIRSRAWQKLKQRLTVDVQVLECGDELIEWGDWAHAAMLTMTYWHPRQEDQVTVRQAVRVPNPADWRPRTGPAAVLCWGFFSGRLLRHPVFVGWR